MPNLYQYEHTTVTQNKAHHADLTRAEVGRSEYLRSDGVTSRKSTHASSAWWEILLPSGERAQLTIDGTSYASPAAGPSLTIAKDWAEAITADTPTFVPPRRTR